MPYQTEISPCLNCNYPKCDLCEKSVYVHFSISPSTTKDKFVESLWRENEDIVWKENEDYELVLDQPWRGFPVGEFTQNDWFYWVDKHHSKGVGWVFDNISPYSFDN